MLSNDGKYRVIFSKGKRQSLLLKASMKGAMPQPAPKADTVASECDGGKGAPEAAPQNVLEAGNEPPASNGAISPGKNDLGDGPSAVATYVGAINRNWESGVDAFMKIARLCAEASELLNSAQRATLVSELLFGEATFSKFARIGKDTRLHTPEIQRLLPPHYTIVYAVTLLKDDELKLAIEQKIIGREMKRAGLQKWLTSRREPSEVGAVPGSEEMANNSGASIVPTQNPIESDPVSARDQPELQDGIRPEPSPDVVHNAAVEAVASPSTVPLATDEISAPLDHRPPPPEEQRALDALEAAWDSHVQPLWAIASSGVRERFRASRITEVSD